jgi:medium-chain acyl-[acyl-carrier-protein] hydrolase
VVTAAAVAPGRALDVRPGSRARLRLFCLPYAGGGASAFRSWQGALGAEVDVLPVYLPGRERRFREPAHTRLEPLADELAEALRPHLELPYALFGHSMGAALAFEVARRLEEEKTPAHLFVSGRGAPHRPPERERIHALPEAEFVRRVREMEGTPDEVLADPEMMELVVPILRADFTLSETYRFREGAPLSAPVTAFGGTGDAYVGRDDLLGWREHTRGFFRLRQFAGGHFFIQTHQAELLGSMAEDLARALAVR